MATVHSSDNNVTKLPSFEPIGVQPKRDDTGAAIAHLSALIEEVLASIPAESSKIVRPNFKGSDGPSNAQMAAAYSALVGLLAQLQGDIAKYSNKIANFNSEVGKALMVEMQAQFNDTIKELNKIAQQQEHASFWSKFTKWIEGILAAIGAVVATLCGQPELALVICAFTTLSLSGAMQKITQGIADLIRKGLVADGVSEEEADKIAKILADITVVAVTIAVTVVTCGAGAAGAVETTTDEAVASTIATAEEVESSSQKFLNFLSENNPFTKLSKTTNFAFLTGSMAAGSTNFGHDIMDASCIKMADGAGKEGLSTAMAILFGLVTALVGAGAGIALAAGADAETALNNALRSIVARMKALLQFQDFNLGSALRTLMGIQIAGTIAQVTGQFGTGAVNIQLASTLKAQGETQALLSELQALIRMNNSQSATNAKALASEMKTWGSEIASLGMRLNDLGRAVASELQA